MKIKQEFETLTTHGNLFKILDFKILDFYI